MLKPWRFEGFQFKAIYVGLRLSLKNVDKENTLLWSDWSTPVNQLKTYNWEFNKDRKKVLNKIIYLQANKSNHDLIFKSFSNNEMSIYAEGHICCIGPVINSISILRAPSPIVVCGKTLSWHRAMKRPGQCPDHKARDNEQSLWFHVITRDGVYRQPLAYWQMCLQMCVS